MIVHRPREQTYLSLSVLGAIPIAVLNLWVFHKAHWDRVISSENHAFLGLVAGLSLFSMWQLLRARWLGLCGVICVVAVFLGWNIHGLVSSRNYALAFFGLFVVLLSSLYVIHLVRSLAGCYYRSGRRWYEGVPPRITGVELEIVDDGARNTAGRLIRLGAEGVFATFDHEIAARNIRTIRLKMHEYRLETDVQWVSQEPQICGYGFRFRSVTKDGARDVLSFIERVRSQGYVS